MMMYQKSKHMSIGLHYRRQRRMAFLIWPLLFTHLAVGAVAQAPTSTGTGISVSIHTCSLPNLPGNAHQRPTDEDLLGAYNAQASLLQTLEATVMLRGSGGSAFGKHASDSRGAPAMLSFRAPGWLRITGVIPFSAQRSFDLSSDGREFRLLVPDGKRMRFYVGPVDAPTTSQNPRENLRPQPLIHALHWARATLSGSVSSKQAGSPDARTITVGLLGAQNDSARSAEIAYDLRNGTVTGLVIRDASGLAVSEIHYADWREVTNGGSAPSPFCFPRRMTVNQPREGIQLEMKLVAITVNPRIPPSKFQLTPPAGLPVKRLGSSEERGNR
jgi:outer membrane lipoprotein-sorting protein